MADRTEAQLAFLAEVDALKGINRATMLHDGSRPENSAEHSWHVALHALILADHAGPDVSIDRVIRMLLLHDIVEIDAGDTPIHGQHDASVQEAKERAAADRLFGLLPADQGSALREIWDEFEAAESPDAVFAKSIDRVQPVLSNLHSGGHSWRDYNVTIEQIDVRVGAKVALGAPGLWDRVREKITPWFAARQG